MNPRLVPFILGILLACHSPTPPPRALTESQILCVINHDERKDLDNRAIAYMCEIDTGGQDALTTLRAVTESMRMQFAWQRSQERWEELKQCRP